MKDDEVSNKVYFKQDVYKTLDDLKSKEDYQSVYASILLKIENKVNEVNEANNYYESLGMFSINDYETINIIIDNEKHILQNMFDVIRYNQDLLNLRLNYLSNYGEVLNNDRKRWHYEFYSSFFDFLNFSKQVLFVIENEILNLARQNDQSLNEQIRILFNFMDTIYSIISRRLVYEVSVNHNENVKMTNEIISSKDNAHLDEIRHKVFLKQKEDKVSNNGWQINFRSSNSLNFKNNKMVSKVNKKRALILEGVNEITLTAIKNGLKVKMAKNMLDKLKKMKAKLALVSKNNYRSRTSVKVENDEFDLAFKKRNNDFDLNDYKVEIRVPINEASPSKTKALYEYDLALNNNLKKRYQSPK